MKYITSAFSLSMLPIEHGETWALSISVVPHCAEADVFEKYYFGGAECRIGHMNTAEVLSDWVGTYQGSHINPSVLFSRKPITLQKGDSLLVFQLLTRPKEGQVFTPEEIRKLLLDGAYKFYEIYL